VEEDELGSFSKLTSASLKTEVPSPYPVTDSDEAWGISSEMFKKKCAQ